MLGVGRCFVVGWMEARNEAYGFKFSICSEVIVRSILASLIEPRDLSSSQDQLLSKWASKIPVLVLLSKDVGLGLWRFVSTFLVEKPHQLSLLTVGLILD